MHLSYRNGHRTVVVLLDSQPLDIPADIVIQEASEIRYVYELGAKRPHPVSGQPDLQVELTLQEPAALPAFQTLSILEADCLHCFSGCTVEAVQKQLGASGGMTIRCRCTDVRQYPVKITEYEIRSRDDADE